MKGDSGMHTWYLAVCDKCKEACHVLVTSSFHLRPDFIQNREKSVVAFLRKHWNHELRLVHSDQDLDKLFEQEYSFLDKDEGEEDHKSHECIKRGIVKQRIVESGDRVFVSIPDREEDRRIHVNMTCEAMKSIGRFDPMRNFCQNAIIDKVDKIYDKYATVKGTNNPILFCKKCCFEERNN